MSDKKLDAQIRMQILIERLLLKRNPLDYQAYIETFRESLIDANPHQIEAITFALEKLENGGCILADEVGLGKTIEAGLVMAQYRANRRFNILIILPTSLAGQWNNELRKRFQVPSKIITAKNKKGVAKDNLHTLFSEDGVYILGREFASRLEKERILSRKQWDLIIVDEAHEIFANIYQRYSARDGSYNFDSKSCKTAANLFRLLKKTPVLLLTATPLQNNILEIWGLSAYILPDTNKNFLGQYNHFRELFVRDGEIPEEKMPELKQRLGNFLVRNLRANAQAFMKYKFTQRHCETVNFFMADKEKRLYDEISNYLERDDIYAYSNGYVTDTGNERSMGLRNLLKLSYRRALGSSFSALSDSLAGILERLEKMKTGATLAPQDMLDAAAGDDPENDEEDCIMLDIESEEDFPDELEPPQDNTDGDSAAIDMEINEVKGFIERAREITETGKDKILVKWLNTIFSEPRRFYQKVVIFTTYIASQRHLKQVLEANGYQDEIVLFCGGQRRTPEENDIVEKAVAAWKDEVGAAVPTHEQPTGNILERTALVHYFKTRKKIFISTEAGAKGLNLQFCNALVNYDLPWNPQRIEQRIGRCHRYGQEKDVWVINCINADNDTEKRIYEILLDKFNLFKSVIGAGDDILGALSKSIQFEKKINDMMNKFKTQEERLVWLERFEQEIDEETRKLRDSKLKRARRLLDELDPNVTMRLKNIENKLPESFSQYDKDVLDLLENYAHFQGLSFGIDKKDEEQIFFRFGERKYYIGKRDEDNIRHFQHISLKHPLVEEITAKMRNGGGVPEAAVYLEYTQSPNPGKALTPYTGRQGRWDFYNIRFSGVEEEEHLFDILVVTDGADQNRFTLLNDEEITVLKRLAITPAAPDAVAIDSDRIQDCLEKMVKEKMLLIQQVQQPRLDRKLHNLEVELRDMEEFLANKETEIKNRMQEVDRKVVTTFDREAGKQLLKEKENCQKDLKQVRKELLNFQDHFQEMFDKEQIKLMEKRFVEAQPRRVFTLNFRIR